MAIKPKSKSDEITVLSNYNLYDPYTNTHFPAGKPTVVPEITNWMQCQIKANLMEVLNG